MLTENGSILVISASLLEDEPVKRLLVSLKDVAGYALEQVGVRKRGQFWGWMRSRKEYRALMQGIGLNSLEDGTLITPYQDVYWIKCSGVSKK